VSQVQAAPVNSPTGSVNDENLRLKNDRLQGEMDKMKEEKFEVIKANEKKDEIIKALEDELKKTSEKLDELEKFEEVEVECPVTRCRISIGTPCESAIVTHVTRNE
jgi:predicted nuclease with TOPRIM domain